MPDIPNSARAPDGTAVPKIDVTAAPRLPVRRYWLLALVAVFLMGAAWAVALPFNGTYDEKDHVVWAYAVASGHLNPAGHVVDLHGNQLAAFWAPASLYPAAGTVDCTWWPDRLPASCQRWTAQRTLVPLPSGAARYSPVYYAVVGLPLLASPNMAGLIAARLLSALLAALLLATAVAAAARAGSSLLLAGLVLTATPLAVNLYGSVNPNGLEIAASACLFATLLALLRAPAGRLGSRDTRRLLAGAGIAGLLLLTVRSMGPLLLLLDVATCALLARPGRLRALLRTGTARWWLGGAWAAGALLAVTWTLQARIWQPAPGNGHPSPAGVAAHLYMIFDWRASFYAKQMVAQFSYGETTVSILMIAAWYLLVAALVGPALVYARGRVTAVLVALGVACMGINIGLELYFLPRVGWYAQGRYVLPAALGVVLAAGAVSRLEPWLSGRGLLRWYVVGAAAAVLPLHLYALAKVMTRFQVGYHRRMNPLGGGWLPATGPAVPLLLIVTGTLLVVLLTVLASQPRRGICRAIRDTENAASTGGRHTHYPRPVATSQIGRGGTLGKP